MSASALRVAVIGLGWVAREVWLPRLARHPGFSVAALADPAVGAGDAPGLPPGARLYRDYREVPSPAVDAVFILTPNSTHAEISSWFLGEGKAVFLEKPVATSRRDLDVMEAAARAGGGRLALSCAARYRTDVGLLRDIVSQGLLGDPRLAELSWVRSSGVPGSGWFTSRASAGGGVLLDLGWHLIDVLHHLWGAAEVRAVTAVASHDFVGRAERSAAWRGDGARLGPSRADAEGHADAEDQMTALVVTDQYAAGLRFAWASHEERDRTVVALHGARASLTLTTTFGFSPLRVEQPSVVLRASGTATRFPLGPAVIGEEYDRQLDALPGLLFDEAATPRAFASARSVLAVIEGCYQACGSWLPCPAVDARSRASASWATR